MGLSLGAGIKNLYGREKEARAVGNIIKVGGNGADLCWVRKAPIRLFTETVNNLRKGSKPKCALRGEKGENEDLYNL